MQNASEQSRTGVTGSTSASSGQGSATACANIALAKYWGKADRTLNLPAVESISLTADSLKTETTVHFDGDLAADEVVLDGAFAEGRSAERITRVLDWVREEAGLKSRARVTTYNTFPTGAGLASSASGFAALVGAAYQAAGLDVDAAQVSRRARRASASAARSVFGGYVRLAAGVPGDDSLAAEPLFPAEHWPLRMLIAVVDRKKKATSSTDGMERTRLTSPFYDAWVTEAPKYVEEIRLGLAARDLERVGRFMERSTLAYIASALAADPGIVYWKGSTLDVYHRLRLEREEQGLPVWMTMDAGPHVKALCEEADADRVRALLHSLDAGIEEIIEVAPGPGLQLHTCHASVC